MSSQGALPSQFLSLQFIVIESPASFDNYRVGLKTDGQATHPHLLLQLQRAFLHRML